MSRERKKEAKALRDEYTRTIDPARALVSETMTLEAPSATSSTRPTP
jgi:hypothetical protein